MLRLIRPPAVAKRLCQSRVAADQRRAYALRAPSDFDEAELRSARQWLSEFQGVPSSSYDVSFSRSSGPGGQNVNKTNSKATLRMPLSTLLHQLPRPLHPAVRQSPYCTARSDSIVISSDESRRQADNVRACEAKLLRLVVDAGRAALPGETSEVTKARVQGLEHVANERRVKDKKLHSSKKSSRKGSNAGGDY